MVSVNGTIVKVEKFPNKEVLIKDNQFKYYNVNDVVFKFENNEDLITLMLVKKHLDEQGGKTKLTISYMPYSRMDRTEGQVVFTLKYISWFINSLNFNKVYILEPHSDVCIALLNKCEAVNMSADITRELMKKLNFKEDDYLFYPDAGAEKRYSKQIQYANILSANKERDFKTGFIKSMTITGDKPNKPFRVIIVDDLCSRGGTFHLAAQKLKEIGATEIYLVTTHCEDTVFEGELLTTDLITEIHTTNSILSDEASNNKLYVTKVI